MSASSFPIPVPVRAFTDADRARFMPLVRRIAIRMARRVPADVTVEDLVGYGWLGLLEAFRRADGMGDGELEAYVSYRIRGAMLDHLRSLDPMARTTRALARRIGGAVGKKTAQLGRAPTEREAAAELEMSVEEYCAAQRRVAEATTTRADAVDIDALASPTAPPDEGAQTSIRKERLAGAIRTLPERLQHVLALYYQEGCTLAEIGEILGVTEARACQLHGDAVRRLRAVMG